jgi:hypothetical protein
LRICKELAVYMYREQCLSWPFLYMNKLYCGIMHLLSYGAQDIRNYNVPYYHPKFLFGGASYMLARKKLFLLIFKSLYVCYKNHLLVSLFMSTNMNIAQPNWFVLQVHDGRSQCLYTKFRVCKSVHHTFNWINQQDAATSQVCYSSFRYSSTCFGHSHAHHQELQ